MGSADIIPGVSGGTIALITGIYEPLIEAIKSVNLVFILDFFRGFRNKRYFLKAKEVFLGIHFHFLLPLIIGIAVAFLILANIIGSLMKYYPTYTFAFFFGLILASVYFVYKSSNLPLQAGTILFLLSGIIVGFFIVGLDAIQTTHSLLIIFLAGIITFCAMILPGISGAFILLVLGQYNFLLNTLRSLTRFDFSFLPYAIAYVAGGIIGILVFSRALSYLIHNYRSATLWFIIGLMIGALRKPGEFIANRPESLLFTLISIGLGICIVAAISYYEIYSPKAKTHV